MLKIIMAAALTGLVTISSASAVPAPLPMTVAQQLPMPELLLVQDRRAARRNDGLRQGGDRRQIYTPGRRYNSAPNGWNRYGNRRPGNWRNRRCIMVGPIWFCP